MYKSKFLTSFAALAFATTASCLTVTPSNDATALANALLGGSSGITLVSATYTGAADGSGLYTAGPQGITDSIVLTTGDAVDVIPSDDTTDSQISKSKGTAGSALCESINGGVATYDAAVLSLNVILSPGYTGFASQYIFATEEYPEWVGSDFNDAFGVWVDGKQIAVDSTGAPITVSGPYFQSSAVLTPPASGSSMDGSTPILMSTYAAAPGAHKIDIAICDTADSLLDSAVFVALRAVPGTNTTSSSSSSIVSSSSTVSSSSSIITSSSSSIVSSSSSSIISSSSIYANTTIVAPTSSSSSIYVSPSSSIIPSSSSSSIYVSPSSSIIHSSSSSYVNTISSIIPTSSSSYSNATITGAPTSSVEPPCVTYTSYIVKTITLCDTSCYPTTTLVPTVVTSTLQLTVYTPCSTVTVSQCTGGPGSPCVTYTNTITYPAITTYPPIPTFTAPVGPASTPSGVPVGPASTPSGVPVGPASTPSGVPVGPASTPSGVPVGPASTPSGVPVGPGSHSSPVPVGPASSPNGPVYTAPVTYTAPAVPTTPVVLPTYTAPASVPYGNGTHGCPGGANCAHPTPSAGFSIPVSNGTSTVHPTTIVPVTSSAPATSAPATSAPAVKPASPSTTAPPSFTGAASRVGMTSGVVVGLVVAVLAAL